MVCQAAISRKSPQMLSPWTTNENFIDHLTMQLVIKVIFDWYLVLLLTKDVWKSVTTTCGARYVVKAGTSTMPEWPVVMPVILEIQLVSQLVPCF